MTPTTDKPVPEPTEADRALADGLIYVGRKLAANLTGASSEEWLEQATKQVAAHRTSAVAEAVAGLWRTGLPPVDEGRQRVFLCSVKDCETPMTLIYSNRYIADMSDGQHDPGEAIETSPDSGEYYWTGWFEEGCSQCDTFWRFDREVEAWMELPACAALHHPEAKGGA